LPQPIRVIDVMNKIVAYLHYGNNRTRIRHCQGYIRGIIVTVELADNATTADLKASLEAKYPRLKQLASYMVAVNNEYAEDAGIIANAMKWR
jgi:hypothetical protein